MDAVEIIRKRRDNIPHSRQELDFLARAAAESTIPDYQIAAWLMAAYLNPLSPQETADLTLAMAESGERADLDGLPKPWVDKHSTGGVGDKTTLVLLPLLAACGLTVVKMSGRGLGVTGGTIDKLESVPGFRTDLSPEEMKAQANEIGLALTGQTPRLAPADKALYALRDVTATVPSLPLIVSSILSKKIAGGADTVVLDVKCGRGAFMADLPQAQALAQSLQEVGEIAGLTVRTCITDMDQPLGIAAGNSLEVKEAVRVLQGEDVPRFTDLCLALATLALQATGHPDPQNAPAEAIRSGAALEKAKLWFQAQGAQIDPFQSHDWQTAPVQAHVEWSDTPAHVAVVDARAIGQTVLDLGGGRKTKTDTIDPTVGVETYVRVGDTISPGTRLFTIHAADQQSAENARQALLKSITTQPAPHPPRPILLP